MITKRENGIKLAGIRRFSNRVVGAIEIISYRLDVGTQGCHEHCAMNCCVLAGDSEYARRAWSPR